jgi:hypothetical protein
MKSPQITSGRQQKASAGWIHGVNSVRNPWTLPEDQFKWGVNIQIRGGIAQTRPGFKMKLSLPKGNLQGGLLFNANKQFSAASFTTTLDGVDIYKKASIYNYDGTASNEFELTYMVFAVDGKVYFLPHPFEQPSDWNKWLLTGIDLDPDVSRVNFSTATQNATINVSGDVTVTPSHRMVIVQDGINQPAYWDGSNSTGAHSEEMPIGYWMAFSGSRLWVATGNVIQASDLGNPLGWEERKSGSGRGDFSIPRPVTAIMDYVGQNNDTRLYVFSDRATYSLASGILDRTQWASTSNFQNTLYPTIGCISGKSICFQAGMMWWYSQGGLISADVAAASYLSSQVLYKDVEMAKAKRLMSAEINNICSVAFENYLLCSIPYLEPINSATMVLDYAPASEWNQSRSPAWAGVWTGIRPIEWTTGVIESQPRVFAFSVDYASTNDGSHNHLWEAFTPERYDTYLHIESDKATDVIQRIYCQMETGLLGDSMDLKQLAYGELDCSEISGTVDVKVSYRGTKGTYQEILNTRLLAAVEDYQFNTTKYAKEIGNLGFLQTQTRRLITENVTRPNLNSCESALSLDVSKGFSFLVEWCGSFGVESVRMFQDPWSEKSVGANQRPESQYCVVGEDGTTISLDLPQPSKENASFTLSSWSSTQTRTVRLSCQTAVVAVSATATATYVSQVSQEDADTQAAALATQQASNAATQYRKINPC